MRKIKSPLFASPEAQSPERDEFIIRVYEISDYFYSLLVSERQQAINQFIKDNHSKADYFNELQNIYDSVSGHISKEQFRLFVLSFYDDQANNELSLSLLRLFQKLLEYTIFNQERTKLKSYISNFTQVLQSNIDFPELKLMLRYPLQQKGLSANITVNETIDALADKFGDDIYQMLDDFPWNRISGLTSSMAFSRYHFNENSTIEDVKWYLFCLKKHLLSPQSVEALGWIKIIQPNQISILEQSFINLVSKWRSINLVLHQLNALYHDLCTRIHIDAVDADLSHDVLINGLNQFMYIEDKALILFFIDELKGVVYELNGIDDKEPTKIKALVDGALLPFIKKISTDHDNLWFQGILNFCEKRVDYYDLAVWLHINYFNNSDDGCTQIISILNAYDDHIPKDEGACDAWVKNIIRYPIEMADNINKLIPLFKELDIKDKHTMLIYETLYVINDNKQSSVLQRALFNGLMGKFNNNVFMLIEAYPKVLLIDHFQLMINQIQQPKILTSILIFLSEGEIPALQREMPEVFCKLYAHLVDQMLARYNGEDYMYDQMQASYRNGHFKSFVNHIQQFCSNDQNFDQLKGVFIESLKQSRNHLKVTHLIGEYRYAELTREMAPVHNYAQKYKFIDEDVRLSRYQHLGAIINGEVKPLLQWFDQRRTAYPLSYEKPSIPYDKITPIVDYFDTILFEWRLKAVIYFEYLEYLDVMLVVLRWDQIIVEMVYAVPYLLMSCSMLLLRVILDLLVDLTQSAVINHFVSAFIFPLVMLIYGLYDTLIFICISVPLQLIFRAIPAFSSIITLNIALLFRLVLSFCITLEDRTTFSFWDRYHSSLYVLLLQPLYTVYEVLYMVVTNILTDIFNAFRLFADLMDAAFHGDEVPDSKVEFYHRHELSIVPVPDCLINYGLWGLNETSPKASFSDHLEWQFRH